MIADYESYAVARPDLRGQLSGPAPTAIKKEQIPRFYSTQMQVMINTLNDMQYPPIK